MGDTTGLVYLIGQAFIKFVMPWLPGVFGTALAWWFLSKGLTYIEKIANFAIGLVICVYMSPILIESFGVTSDAMQDGIKLALGMSGYTIAREAFDEIPNLHLFRRIWDKLFGAKT